MSTRFWSGEDGLVGMVVSLAMATGAMDVISFMSLGHVFTSVMTGNIARLGLAVGRRDPTLAISSGLGIAGFILGAGVGARLTQPPSQPGGLSRSFPRSMLVQASAMVLLAMAWDLSHARPEGSLQWVLLLLASLCMGSQSAAVYRLGVSGLSSTYMTGTLTGVISELVPFRVAGQVGRGIAALLALALGAVFSGLLVVFLPMFAPWFRPLWSAPSGPWPAGR